jgi:hypothetical protein
MKYNYLQDMYAPNSNNIKYTISRRLFFLTQTLIILGLALFVNPLSAQAQTATTTAPTIKVTLHMDVLPWLYGTKSPWKDVTAVRSIFPAFMTKIIKSQSTKNHAGWTESRLDDFAVLQTNLTLKLNSSYDKLDAQRTRLLRVIKVLAKTDSDLSDVNRLLHTASDDMARARISIDAVNHYTPEVFDGNKKIIPSTMIKLGKPREVGLKAIKDIVTAQKSLTDVNTELTHAAGY